LFSGVRANETLPGSRTALVWKKQGGQMVSNRLCLLWEVISDDQRNTLS